LIAPTTPKTFFKKPVNNLTISDDEKLSHNITNSKEKLTQVIRNLMFYEQQLSGIFNDKNNVNSYDEIESFLVELEENLTLGEEIENQITKKASEKDFFSSKYMFLVDENNTAKFNIEDFNSGDRKNILALLDKMSVVNNSNIGRYKKIKAMNTTHQMYADFNSDVGISFIRLTDEVVLILTICKPHADIFRVSQEIIEGEDSKIDNLKASLRESDDPIKEQMATIMDIKEKLGIEGATKK
jgi:hypothetical protein